MRWPLSAGFAFAVLCGTSAYAGSRNMTNLVPPLRELRIDPTVLPPAEGKTYHIGDVVLRAYVREPSSVVLSETRTIDLNGFSVTLAKGTRLIQRALMRSKRQGWFTFDSGVGAEAAGDVFCTTDRLALGPFTSGENTNPFKALACLIDIDKNGSFDQATFVGPYGAREAGPVPVPPLAYELIPGSFNYNRVELTFDRLSKNGVYLKTTFFDPEGKHSAYLEFDVNEGLGYLISYSHGCTINASATRQLTPQLLGTRMSLISVDAIGLSFRASIEVMPQANFAYVVPSATKYDWVPSSRYCSSG